MPMPQHCIDCDKVAVILDDVTPYCTRCYKKHQKGSKNSTCRVGHLSNSKLKS